jgi:ABC-2 type transport system ATP-binding protein
MEILRTENIIKKYGDHYALNGVSMNINEGSVYGLIGPNGAGKTTLIRILTQILLPDSGSVFYCGETLNESHAQYFGYMPEERGLYKKMKVGEQSMYLARLRGLSQSEAKKELQMWFEKFEIMPWWNKKVEELSKGMQQKVQFINTVVHKPRVLVLDEPFSGFDPINVDLIKNEISNMRKDDVTIIYSTHNMASVEELCNSISLIYNGKEVLSGEVSSIRNRYRKNIFEIICSGKTSVSLPTGFDVISNTFDSSLNQSTLQIALSKEGTANEVLFFFIHNHQIIGCKEILPTISEIFVEQVKNSNSLLPLFK